MKKQGNSRQPDCGEIGSFTKWSDWKRKWSSKCCIGLSLKTCTGKWKLNYWRVLVVNIRVYILQWGNFTSVGVPVVLPVAESFMFRNKQKSPNKLKHQKQKNFKSDKKTQQQQKPNNIQTAVTKRQHPSNCNKWFLWLTSPVSTEEIRIDIIMGSFTFKLNYFSATSDLKVL